MLSVVVAGSAGCAAGRSAERVSRAAPPASRSAVAGATSPTAAGPTGTTEVIDFPVGSWRRLPSSPPVRLEIPAIGVSSPWSAWGCSPTGRRSPRLRVAGWFTGGPMPGQLGPAVIAGHVDSRTGPAVFYRLRDLRAPATRSASSGPTAGWSGSSRVPGQVSQAVAAGRRGVRRHHRAGLRLITCAGDFDRSQRSYRDNLVVSAIRVRDGAGGGGAAGR